IIRDLKTTPFGVILFGHSKTKNLLTTRAKEQAQERDEKFDRQQDPYRHCYELLPLTKTMDQSLVDRIDDAVAGEGPAGDAFTAIILAIETLDADTSIKSYSKEICVITDGESPINWDGIKSAAKQMNSKNISLSVIGMDFDDEDLGYEEEAKSDIKRENERQFAQLVELLEQYSIIANARLALAAITTPQVKTVNSRADRMRLTFGNPAKHPESSLSIWVDVKKAVVAAAAPTMKQMSLRGFERAGPGQRGGAFSQSQGFLSQSQTTSQQQQQRGIKRGAEALKDDDDEDEEAKEAIRLKEREAAQATREHQAQAPVGDGVSLGRLGVTLDSALERAGLRAGDGEDADLATHGVTRERRFYYRPAPKPLDEQPGASSRQPRDSDDESSKEDDDQDDRMVEDEAQLTAAYHYGGSLVDVGELEDDAGLLSGLETGMEIISFMKESDLRYDYRMGDVFYVTASRGQLGSEKLFSALVNAMDERSTMAVVRFVKKGYTRNGLFRMPDPQVGVLYPKINEEGVEYCTWVRFPFAEDLRQFQLGSLERLFNRKGKRVHDNKLLPTEEMDDAMDDFVDAMDLTEAGPPDEEGNPTEFFSVEDSFSPAIHNIQNTLVFRLSNPDGDLPPVPPVLTKYMDPPASLAAQSEEAAQKVLRAFDIRRVPPKPKKINKRNQNYAQPDLEDEIELDAIFGTQAAGAVEKVEAKTAPAVHPPTQTPSPIKPSAHERAAALGHDDVVLADADKSDTTAADVAAAINDEGDDDVEPDTDDAAEPDTEDEADEDAVLVKVPPSMIEKDIQQNMSQAKQFVETSFSTSRYSMATDEIKAARNSAQKHNVANAFNSSLKSLVTSLRGNAMKRDYLAHLREAGLGLIVGGEISQADADAFLEALDT
ncbi:uncharacterized protein JCM10292_002859, partial [Rhodotorula paludigena]|uniref:uncharacterized protein n=1 Tax=Rhodotorula paludigena TaxID=86838 RepID=UPI00316B8A83